MELNKLLPLNLQFFAEGDGSGGDDNGGGDDGGNATTFTQEQVTSMMAKEKKEGRRALLRAYGFKSESELKAALEATRKAEEGNDDDDDLGGDDNSANNSRKASGRNTADKLRAEKAENKLACIMAGVNKDSIDDALAIAVNKVTKEKTLDAVLGEMKKETKYSAFFAEEDDGTGSEPGSGGGKGGDKDNFGKRLAEKNKANTKKSSYF